MIRLPTGGSWEEPVPAEEEWTVRMKRGRTEASTLYPDLNSVRLYADSTLPGLECLPADFCRSLGDISARPSALSDPLLSLQRHFSVLAKFAPLETRFCGRK